MCIWYSHAALSLTIRRLSHILNTSAPSCQFSYCFDLTRLTTFNPYGYDRKSFQVRQKVRSCSLLQQDSWIVAPEKGNNNAFCALAAICTNLRKDRTALLARFLPRVNGDISIGFMTPYPSSRTGAKACLIMNVLPFEADLRQASFTAFSQNPDLLPHKDQTAAIEGLIEAFTLQEGLYLLLVSVSASNIW